MRTPEQERVHRLGVVRALLDAAAVLLEEAYRAMPQARASDRDEILSVHQRIAAARTQTKNAITHWDRIEP